MAPLPRGDQQHTKRACLVGQTDHDIAVWGLEAHGVAVAGNLWHGHSGAGQAEEEEGTHDVGSGLHGVRGWLCVVFVGGNEVCWGQLMNELLVKVKRIAFRDIPGVSPEKYPQLPVNLE
jgi:hypothetical protein